VGVLLGLPRTNNHDVEVEALAHTLAMPLVGQVREPNVACELSAHNVHVVRHGSCGLGVLCRHRLCGLLVAIGPRQRLVHGVGAVGGRGRRRGGTRGRDGGCDVRFYKGGLAGVVGGRERSAMGP
jgi:hypothetical protein